MNPPTHTFQLPDGTITLEDTSGSAISDIHTYTIETESDLIGAYLKSLEADDVVFDIGARTGLYTCLAAESDRPETVVAFEPDPEFAEQIRTNLSYNTGSAEVYEYILSDSEESVPFNNTSYEGIRPEPSTETVRRTTKTIDGLVEAGIVPQPNVVKIDVEGAEGAVLAGMQQTLAEPACHSVFCELHLPADHRPSFVDFGFTKDQLYSDLADAGFHVEELTDRGSEILMAAKKDIG